MTDVPPDIKRELRRSVAFVAVFNLWTAFEGVTEETVNEYLIPHRETVEQILDEHPSLSPTLDENPADVIEDDLRESGMLNQVAIEDALTMTREFYEKEDVLPIELETEL